MKKYEVLTILLLALIVLSQGAGPAGAQMRNAAIMSPIIVPSAPMKIVAVAGDAQATVSFSAPASDGGSMITLYTVTSHPDNITAVGGKSPIIVETLTNGTTYNFTVTATNVMGEGPSSEYSNNVTPMAAVSPPLAPTDLTAARMPGPAVQLTWQDNSLDEDGFVVERSDNGGAYAGLATLTDPGETGAVNYTDTTVATGNYYAYRVTAYNSGGSSASSNVVNLSLGVLPAAPSGLTATVALQPDGDLVTLNWVDNSDNETGFVIQSATKPDFTTGLISSKLMANTIRATQLVARGNTVWFRVQAVNAAGASAWSNGVSIKAP